MTDPGRLPPPGWYADPAGHTRWWSGVAWGAYAPPAAPAPVGYVPPGPVGSYPPGAVGPYPPGAVGQYPGGYPLPSATGRADARSLAMLAQLGQIVGGFILPLVLYLTAGKDDPFVRHHSAESLNMSITYVIAYLALFPLFFIGIIVWPLLLIVVPLFFIVIIGHLVLSIVAAVKAYRGEWWRYPICIRLVSGSVGSSAR